MLLTRKCAPWLRVSTPRMGPSDRLAWAVVCSVVAWQPVTRLRPTKLKREWRFVAAKSRHGLTCGQVTV